MMSSIDADEVRRRKEYAERKVRERHLQLKKEADERRKMSKEHREKVQSQLRREQELLQKRMQALNEDEERKRATLAKQHEATSRIASLTKSPKSFAFGSSTPRTLAYLDNLPKSEQQYDKKLKPLNESGSSSTTSPQSRSGRSSLAPSRPPPAAHKPAPTLASMTTSLYVTSSAPTTRTRPQRPAMTPSTRRAAPLPATSAAMTQSFFTPSRPNAAFARTTRATPPSRGATPPVQQQQSKKPPRGRTVAQRAEVVRKQKEEAVKAAPLKKSETRIAPEDVKKDSEPEVAAEIVHKEPEVVEAPIVILKEENVEAHIEREVEAQEEEALKRASEEAHAPFEPKVEVHSETEEKQAEEIPAQTQSEPESTSLEDELQAAETSLEEELKDAGALPDKQLIDLSGPSLEDELNAAEHPLDTIPEVETSVTVELCAARVASHEVVMSCEPTMKSSVETTFSNDVETVSMDANRFDETLDYTEDLSKERPRKNSESLNAYLAEVERNLKPGCGPMVAEAMIVVSDNVDKDDVRELDYNHHQIVDDDDEEADSGKASPTNSETSSTIDDVTPRTVVERQPMARVARVKTADEIADDERKLREAEEKKAKIAAILAKSRQMALPTATTAMMNLPGQVLANDSPTTPIAPTVAAPPTRASITPSAVSPNAAPNSDETMSRTRTTTTTTDGSGTEAVLARLAANPNLPSLAKLLQRKQGSNPSLKTSESNGGEIFP
ncbi:unnamed protein product [Caenorhabditis bovis]|uniref:Uncharacterized protein n=1 Tax=Caenorhabditis bovis TaxID=2654633 RepID=A0A8S1F6K1_9PELO|nr:unnamed protein product [Caenorhabditis bovis]